MSHLSFPAPNISQSTGSVWWQLKVSHSKQMVMWNTQHSYMSCVSVKMLLHDIMLIFDMKLKLLGLGSRQGESSLFHITGHIKFLLYCLMLGR